MVAYEPNRAQSRTVRSVRDVSTRDTEVHGVRVFDSWNDDDLDGSIDQVAAPRSVFVPGRPAPAPSPGFGPTVFAVLRSLAMMMFGGVLGMGIVSVVLVVLFVGGGVAAAAAVLYTVPIIDVVSPEPPRALPKTNPDADLVVMPDPGFREKPEQKPKKR